mmetsp:Transcript_43697/g.102580  ORF Transcript_43697/g.102580 Transcript_43697/m.102580 type:complete len:123 (-) Transcript_43697:469-837(-)
MPVRMFAPQHLAHGTVMRGLSTAACLAVPLVDISGLDGDAAARKACVRSIKHACEGAGFMYPKGRDMDEAAQAEVLGAARAFFALPSASKAEIDNVQSYCFRGYVSQGLENTAGVPDEREQV